jgi:hypothetical protein
MLKEIFKKSVGRAWTIDLAQVRDKWRADVNAAMNFRVS